MAEADEEQLEAIKKWWDENGKSLVFGGVLALVGVFGYQAWQTQVRETGEAASAVYEDMLAAITLDSPFATIGEEQLTTGRFLANQLKEQHADSTYAHFAAMFLARLAVDEGDLDAAKQELNWAIDNGMDESLVVIAKMRLARVHLAAGDADAGLGVLSGVEPGEHVASFEEARGDLYLAKGDQALARESYKVALDSLEDDDVRPMLQMKLDDMSIAVDATPVAVVNDDSMVDPAESNETEEAN